MAGKMRMAQWMGGPFDGTFERLNEGATKFAVAWDSARHRIPNIPDLQAATWVDGWRPPYLPEHIVISEVHVYDIKRISDTREIIVYRERPASVTAC